MFLSYRPKHNSLENRKGVRTVKKIKNKKEENDFMREKKKRVYLIKVA